MIHTVAIQFLKREISRLVGRVTEIEQQLQPLLDEKTELELMAQEISNSINKLVQDEPKIGDLNETGSES